MPKIVDVMYLPTTHQYTFALDNGEIITKIGTGAVEKMLDDNGHADLTITCLSQTLGLEINIK